MLDLFPRNNFIIIRNNVGLVSNNNNDKLITLDTFIYMMNTTIITIQIYKRKLIEDCILNFVKYSILP